MSEPEKPSEVHHYHHYVPPPPPPKREGASQGMIALLVVGIMVALSVVYMFFLGLDWPPR